jgi:hypothetical protein
VSWVFFFSFFFFFSTNFCHIAEGVDKTKFYFKNLKQLSRKMLAKSSEILSRKKSGKCFSPKFIYFLANQVTRTSQEKPHILSHFGKRIFFQLNLI